MATGPAAVLRMRAGLAVDSESASSNCADASGSARVGGASASLSFRCSPLDLRQELFANALRRRGRRPDSGWATFEGQPPAQHGASLQVAHCEIGAVERL